MPRLQLFAAQRRACREDDQQSQRSGMRWSCEGGQNILTFRTLVKSQRWEDAWQQYKTFAKAA